MAAASSAFKVKCPSCEAVATIRDPSLVGKKIDCPKCKFRFVVETPAGAGDAETEEKPAKAGTAVVKAKKKGEEAKGEGAKSKNKPLPKREEDVEAGDDKKKPKKKGKSNSTLMIGGGIAVLGIGVLVAYLAGMFGGDETPAPGPKDDDKGKQTDQVKGNPGRVTPNKVDSTKVDSTKVDPNVAKVIPVRPADAVQDEITNLLPADSIWVFKVNGKEFVDTAIGSVFFDESGDAARAFKRWMGFSGDDVEQFACSGSSDGAFLGVFRLKRDLRAADLQAAMETEAKAKTLRKRDLYTIKSNDLITMLGEYLSVRLGGLGINLPKVNGPRAFAFSLTDSRTLVIADQSLLENLLNADLKWKHKTTYVPPDLTGAPKTPNTPETKEKADPDAPRIAFTSNPTLLAVDPSLKVMINQLEGNKTTVLAFAIKMANADQTVGSLFKKYGVGFGIDKILLPPAATIGLVVRKMDREKLNAAAAIEFPKAEDAQIRAANSQNIAELMASKLTDLFHVRVGVGPGNGMVVPIDPLAALDRPADRLIDVAANPIVDGAQDDRPIIEVFQQPPGPGDRRPLPGREMRPRSPFDPMGPMMMDPTMPPTSTVTITSSDKYLVVTADIDWKTVYNDYISPSVRSEVDLLKGEALMMTGRANWHSLAGAVKKLETAGTIPQAAFPRDTDSSRFDLPYPPEKRVSWMVDLLPHLGHEALWRKVKRNAAWDDKDNQNAGSAWISEFLYPDYPSDTWRARVHSLDGRELGATHFVGLTGIGMESGEYPDTPEYAKRLGIFGYNRQAKFADVVAGDGLANTIFMIQVPPNVQRPWIRGGGATVQGVPETGSIKPFVSVSKDGKRGTHVLMADGSIRFISETVSDDVFKALATYKGGEKVAPIDTIAPVEKMRDTVLTSPMVEVKKEEPKKEEPKKGN